MMKWTKQLTTAAALTLLLGCAEKGSTDADKASTSPMTTSNETVTLTPPAPPAPPPDVKPTNAAPPLPDGALASKPLVQTNSDDKK